MGWLWGILLVIGIGWIIRDSTKHIYELLCGLSEDVNDIKRKLGIEILYARTPEQKDESTKKYIRKAIREGDKEKSIKELLGFWGFRKYKWYVNWCKEELKKEHSNQ